MPTVPKIEQNTVQTRPIGSPRLGGQVNFSAPSVIVPDNTAAFRNVENAFFQLSADSKRKADEAAILEASNTLDQWEIDNLFDPNNGALNTKGKSAFDVSTKVGGNFQKFTGDMRKNLGNDDQRLAFDKLVSSRRNSMTKTLFRHERAQMDAYQTAQYDSARFSAKQRAFLHYNDPEEIANSITSMQATIRSDGLRRGLDQKTINNQITVETSELYRGTLLAALASDSAVDTLKAKALFDDLRDNGDLLAKDILDIDNKLDRLVPAAAAEIEFGGLKGGETRSDLEKIANELDSTSNGAGDEFLKLAEERDRGDFYNQMDQPGGAARALHDLESGKYAGLDDAERAQMKSVAKSRFEKEAEEARILGAAQKSIDHEDLHKKSIDRTLTFSEVEAFKAKNSDDPDARDYADMLMENLSTPEKALAIAKDEREKARIKKRAKGQEDVSSTAKYLDLWERYREFEVLVKTDKKGEAVTKGGSEASISDLIEFQRDVVRAQRDGDLSSAQAANFQKMVPIIRKKIDSAISPGFWERFGGAMGDDIYADAYDQAVQFIDSNPEIDNESTRKALFDDIFTVADAINAEEIDDRDIKAEKLEQVGRKVVNRYVKTQFPEFQGIPDDAMPSTIFKADGRALNIPAGAATASGGNKVEPKTPLRDSYNTKNGQTITLEQIKDTAASRNITPQEVVRQMRLKGIIE